MSKENFVKYVRELNNLETRAYALQRCIGDVPIASEGFLGEVFELCGNMILETLFPDGISDKNYELFWNNVIDEYLSDAEIADLFEELTANG